MDSEGKPYNQPLWDDPMQADICEIIRTLIVKGIIRDKDSKNIVLTDLHSQAELLDQIECAKTNDNVGGICAVAGSSYFDAPGWTIIFGGDTIAVNDGTKVRPMWRETKMAQFKLKEEKVNDDRTSAVEEKAKLDAEKELKEITAETANEASKKEMQAAINGKGPDIAAPELPEMPTLPDEKTEDELELTEAKLQRNIGTEFSDTYMKKNKQEFTALERSMLPLSINESDPEKWKLAIVMINM
jgi:hypothetical protein